MLRPVVSDVSTLLLVAQPATESMDKGRDASAAPRLVSLLAVIATHAGLIVWLNAAPVQTEPRLASQVPVMTGVVLVPPAPQPVVEPPRPLPIERPVVRPAPQPSAPILQEAPATVSPPETVVEDAAPETAPSVFTLPQVDENTPELWTPVVIPPRIDASHLNNPAPPYPPVSRRLREEGKVLLEVYILSDGTVGEIRLKTSSGYPRLDKSALEAVQHWRYVPAKRGGEPIPYWYVQPIVFSLRN